MANDNNLELSRRKILAGMGAMGAAGAVAGLGTSALFNDTEEFANNQLTAGELDLVMDWEEHYSFPQIYDEFTDPTVENGNELDVVRSEPSNTSEYVALPDPNPGVDREPVVWANDSDDPLNQGGSDPDSSLDLYFANTIIEAFPDEQSTAPNGTFTRVTPDGEPDVVSPCDTLANVPSDLSTYNEGPIPSDGAEQNPGRTNNSDTRDKEANEFKPLLNLTDVKPGDFGEFTFSTHLCDNPGYLWLQMPDGLTENENGVLDPEVDDDPDNDQELDSGGGSGELAANVETTLWYDDNCNNRIDGEPEDTIALAIIDTSDSQTQSDLQKIANAADQLATRIQNDAVATVYAGVITLDNTGDARDCVLRSLSNEPPITEAEKYVGNLSIGGDIIPGSGETGGNSPLPHALDLGRDYLEDVVANDGRFTGNENKEILVLSDGAPGYGSSETSQGAGDAGVGDLIDDTGSNITDSNGDDFVSDHFDTVSDGDAVFYPDPSNTSGGTQAGETVLVARDLDGGIFAQGSNFEQPAGPKQDRPNDQANDDDPMGSPGDIDGGNDITVKAVATTSITEGQRVMQAIATGQNMANYYNLADNTAVSIGNAVFGDLPVIAGEEVIFRGTLDELENELDPTVDGGPVALDHDRTAPGQDCFPAGATHCFGLAWWVPIDVDNRIQSDSVSFDLGFYTEQCRNNPDPSGP